jgi:hypothetical protein
MMAQVALCVITCLAYGLGGRIQQRRWKLAVKDVVAILCKLMDSMRIFWGEPKLLNCFDTQWVWQLYKRNVQWHRAAVADSGSILAKNG